MSTNLSQTAAPARKDFVDQYVRALQFQQLPYSGLPSHAPNHAIGGLDPVSPASIGAVDLSDPRLTDSRNPLAHNTTHYTGGSDPLTASNIGACSDTDPRLSDNRFPTSHKSTHAVGGTDALSPTDLGATSANTANTIVLRGASGGFSAGAVSTGAVTATSLNGPLTGTVGASGQNTGAFTTLTSSSTATLGPTSLIGLGLDVRGFMNVENSVGIGTIRARDDNHLISIRGLYGASSYTDVMAFYEYGDYRFFNNGFVGAQTEKFRISQNGLVRVYGSFSRSAPVTVSANFIPNDFENWFICNSASTITVSLPAVGNYTGREIMFKNINSGSVVSAFSNVVPLAGGAATTSILSGGAGNWCTIVSNGSDWVIMQAG